MTRKEQLRDQIRVALANAKTHRDTIGVRAILELLELNCQQWVEQAVGQTPDRIQQLHGASKEVRELVAELTRDTPTVPRHDGGFGHS